MKVSKEMLQKWKVKGITMRQIDEFTTLTGKREMESVQLSDALKSHQDGSKDRTLPAKDTETKEMLQISENDLWHEIRELGWDGNRAGDALKKAYPKLWIELEKEEKAKTAYQVWMIQTFGFDISTMSPANLVRLIMALIQMHFEER